MFRHALMQVLCNVDHWLALAASLASMPASKASRYLFLFLLCGTAKIAATD